jgi:cardiolipin synthase
VLYDWLGCRARTRPSFWERLRAGGVEVRCYNPARFSLPLQWISRDHRKLLCVDGQTAFTGGLCIGHDWAGNPTRNVPPWRDTAVEIRGPAVGYLEAAFADSWNTAGAAMPPGDAPQPDAIARAGDLGVWVIAGRPDSAGLYRLEQLIAQVVERSLWLADAYFVATTNYVHALTGAARAGVDVRLLVPGSNNWPVVQALSRAGYRPLLEAGVRVFEWNGPMMHAKTAVADGCWARIGSSNSNLASWISNRELDVTINDADFARQMEAMYESDLENATEIVLESGRVRGAGSVTRGRGGNRGRGVSSTGRLVAGAVGIGSAVGANISQQRILGVAESYLLLAGGISLAGLGVTLVLWPAVFAYPLGLFGGWIGITLVLRAWKLWLSRPGNKII